MTLRLFLVRLWLADKLLGLGAWVQPEYRSRHRFEEDGTITFWREPA